MEPFIVTSFSEEEEVPVFRRCGARGAAGVGTSREGVSTSFKFNLVSQSEGSAVKMMGMTIAI